MTKEASIMETGATAQLATTEQKPKKAKKRYMPFVQLSIVLAFIAVMYYSFSGNVLSKSTAVPMQIGQLVRYQFETENNAIPQIRQLYGTEMPIDSAYVAHFEGADTRVNVWVGEANAEDIMKLFGDLTKKIETGENTVYTDLKKQDVGGMTVYSVKKNNEPQYYYQSGKKFVWIDIQGNSANASQLLVDAMRAITGSHDGM